MGNTGAHPWLSTGVIFATAATVAGTGRPAAAGILSYLR